VGEVITCLGDDPNTEGIALYMETIGDARGFFSAAREVALTKPILVIKPGRTEQATKAAASHTGSLLCSDEILAKQPRPTGLRLSIATNAGGPAVARGGTGGHGRCPLGRRKRQRWRRWGLTPPARRARGGPRRAGRP